MIMGSAYQPSSRGNQMSQHAGKTLLAEVDPSNEALHLHHNNTSAIICTWILWLWPLLLCSSAAFIWLYLKLEQFSICSQFTVQNLIFFNVSKIISRKRKKQWKNRYVCNGHEEQKLRLWPGDNRKMYIWLRLLDVILFSFNPLEYQVKDRFNR